MSTSRRSFLYAAAAAATAQSLSRSLAAGRDPLTQGQGNDEVRVGLVGCGGRGSGAISQALSTKGLTKLVAVADMFGERLDGCLDGLSENESFKKKVDVPKERRFVGPDAYLGVMASNCDVVLVATPPHFRPAHFEAAVQAKKHVFFEKPVAVDSPGVRRVLAAAEAADKLGLSVCSGLQRHHQNGYLETMKRIHGGDLGRLLFARCSWNQGSLWHVARQPEMSDMEWQLRNWLYFTWLSGDHVVEQHVHNIDVVNWAFGDAHPVRCVATGGRQVRTQPVFGAINDHFAIDFEYPGDRFAASMCRQQDGTDGRVEEIVYGTEGTLLTSSGRAEVRGRVQWKFTGPNPNPYVQEHVSLQDAVRGNAPYLNEGRRIAESTMTAIMGRMAAYTGKDLSWDAALADPMDLVPKDPKPGPGVKESVAIPGQQAPVPA